MLDVAGLSVRYGKHLAVSSVSLKVAEGEVVAILGANGSGKSSTLKAVAGLLATQSDARVHLVGVDVSRMPATSRVEQGLVLVPEGRGLFGELTVRENLRLGAFPTRARQAESDSLDRVFQIFPRLQERLSQVVKTMSGGEQQMLAIGRALMSRPIVLMLDEPSLGLSPVMTSELFRALRRVKDQGTSILLVEQNARKSLNLADRAYLLASGCLVGGGIAAELLRDQQVVSAYLGGAQSTP